jgi:hypothetical protein
MLCNTVPKKRVKIDCSAECDVIFCDTFACINIQFIPVSLFFSGNDFGDKYSQIRL